MPPAGASSLGQVEVFEGERTETRVILSGVGRVLLRDRWTFEAGIVGSTTVY